MIKTYSGRVERVQQSTSSEVNSGQDLSCLFCSCRNDNDVMLSLRSEHSRMNEGLSTVGSHEAWRSSPTDSWLAGKPGPQTVMLLTEL